MLCHYLPAFGAHLIFNMVFPKAPQINSSNKLGYFDPGMPTSVILCEVGFPKFARKNTVIWCEITRVMRKIYAKQLTLKLGVKR